MPTIAGRGTLAQQERWLPGLVTYEKVGAWAITEPDSGSDAFGGMKSYVIRDGDDYILNGQKTFITNGPDADVVVVYAKLDEGDGVDKRDRKVLTFVLDRGMEGFVQSKPFRKMGIHSSRTGELFFNNVRLGRDRLLGETEDNAAGDGRASARSNFSAERIGVAAMALGVIEECLRLCVDYAKTRTLWGQEIAQFQLIQLKLANMEVARMNVRNMLFRVIEAAQTGAADLAGRGVGDQVVLLAGGDRRRDGGRAAVRRQRLHDRIPRRAAGPRRQIADDLRGKQRSADHPRRPGPAQRTSPADATSAPWRASAVDFAPSALHSGSARALWYRQIAAAAATLRLSAPPAIGIRTRSVAMPPTRRAGRGIRARTATPSARPDRRRPGWWHRRRWWPAPATRHREARKPLPRHRFRTPRDGEDAARRCAQALSVVGVDAVAGEHDRVGAHRVGDPDQRARITGFGDLDRDGDQPRRAGEHIDKVRRRHFAHRDQSDRCHGVRQRFCGAFGDDMHRHVTQHRPEPGQCGFGDEDLDDEPAPQRRLDEVRPLGEEAFGTAPTGVAMQLDRCRHPVGALGECQAASPDGALTSSGSAPLATSTSAVNAAGSLTAISARFLRSTSTPAALRPWISRL